MNRTKDKFNTGSNRISSSPSLQTNTCGEATISTKSVHEIRKEQVRLRVRRRRQRETAVEKKKRLEKERLRAADRRQKESEIEREARRTDGKLRASQKRVNETVEESARRRERNRIYMAERRRAARENRIQSSDGTHGELQNYETWMPSYGLTSRAKAAQQLSKEISTKRVHGSDDPAADSYGSGRQIHRLLTEHSNMAISTAAVGFSGGFPSMQPRSTMDMANSTNNVTTALGTLLTEAPAMTNVLIEPTVSSIIPTTTGFRTTNSEFNIAFNSAPPVHIDRLLPSFYSTTGAPIEQASASMSAPLMQRISSYPHINSLPLTNAILSASYAPFSHPTASRGLCMPTHSVIPLAQYPPYHLAQPSAVFPSLTHYQQQPRTVSNSAGMFSQTSVPNYSNHLPNYATNIFYM
ncbi:hypothetical protein COEREDRAFT_7281 [Coemansia reversa NRRL 1564]|uniref:Uncharacterized protein n=1 Tax=Coemansia reversa (strain ATCC 12441 / NRRL 1564) TaxID=763665 RepID=A0A2G5BFA3_COERN|nr:hypothetical protein COEREDRAFT_7281 [Coemansia reversa NRRL 1564]|eukprot:PIA17684.1 hypothetical protein COEREDRAFT_7281 [Coemansia reversa NRRL 1564]